MAKILTSILIIASLSMIPVRSWWCTGHMLVAQVAYDDLK